MTLEIFAELAKAKGGTILSKKYTNLDTKVLWNCKNNHQWLATLKNAKRVWCHICNRNMREDRPSVSKISELAAQRLGKLLSLDYETSYAKLSWECKYGHRWEATYSNIKTGKWCPKCHYTKSENICRQYFEQIFKLPFPKIRPSWLKNPETNRSLELDGYCEELGIAFEHNGTQHYKLVNKFHQDKESLKKIQKHDSLKQKLCLEHSIKLIVIPELNKEVLKEDLLHFIQAKCKELEIEWNEFPEEIKLDEVFNFDEKYLNEFGKIANERGGKLLSTKYFDLETPLIWQCACGNIWSAQPRHIKYSNTWCPNCSLKIGSIAKMQQLASKHNGQCLSEAYINNNTKLLWKCERNHTFQQLPRAVQSGQWCKLCKRAIKNSSRK